MAIFKTGGIFAATGACLLLGACAQLGGTTPTDMLATQTPPAGTTTTASTTPAGTPATTASTTTTTPTPGATTAPTTPGATRAELAKATEFWGKAYEKNPRDPQTALNYARNLKAMGEKQQAMLLLQQAMVFHSQHRGIVGEYGRLALEFEQITLAEKLLEQADDPTKPDWKIISARGTVLAKQGQYQKSIEMFQRALAVAPGQVSVLSNLAMSYAMAGEPEKAEVLLRQALATGRADARINQNLALVLGLQGKYDEAKITAARDLPPDGASSNVDFLQKMVQLPPKAMAMASTTPAQPDKVPGELKGAVVERTTPGWSTSVAVAKKQ